jgi:N-acetylglucosaminyl-diphospho-decaprenol L-rhamnosyltransferase
LWLSLVNGMSAVTVRNLMQPSLDIVVVTYNNEDVVGDLLDSLPGAVGDLDANVIVVDNGSTDNTVEVLLNRGDCKVILSSNVGYAAGINRGVREGSGADAILVLNPDTRLQEGCIAPLYSALRFPRTGIVGPRVLSSDGALYFSLRRNPTLLRALGLTRLKLPAVSELVQEAAAYEQAHVVDWAVGAVLMMTRQCFDLLAGWDESFFLYSEETDLSLRARDHGLVTRYEPQSVVVHIGGGSGRSEKTFAMQAINRVRLYGRRHNRVATWCFYGLILARELRLAARGDRGHGFVAAALLRPSLRPAELKCSPRLLPGWLRFPGRRYVRARAIVPRPSGGGGKSDRNTNYSGDCGEY